MKMQLVEHLNKDPDPGDPDKYESGSETQPGTVVNLQMYKLRAPTHL